MIWGVISASCEVEQVMTHQEANIREETVQFIDERGLFIRENRTKRRSLMKES